MKKPQLKDAEFLAQGTLYTDVIESGTDTAQTIKSHHNVGGLPEKMGFKLIEPLRSLFKDETRCWGKAGIAHDLVWRQPFPGPGLGSGCWEITPDKLAIVRESDAILREEIKGRLKRINLAILHRLAGDSLGRRDGGWPDL